MIFKKILWSIKRHPFLYLTRFKLLSKNSSIDGIDQDSYNSVNPKEDIPSYFYEINEQIFKDGKADNDLDIIKQISIWLYENIKGGPGLSVPSEEALKIMLAGKGGVCSDMAQIFNNFCVINDLKVREWGSTRSPFNKEYGGHSFNEVYCKELQKWVLIDVYYCVLFYLDNETPISVIDLYESIRKGKEVRFTSFNSQQKLDRDNIDNIYLDPSTTPFLICNYSNKVYDNFLRYTRPYIPVFVSHFFVYLIGKSYYYRFPLDDYKKLFS